MNNVVYGPQECPDVQHSVHDGMELVREAYQAYEAANERVLAAEGHLARVKQQREDAHARFVWICADALGEVL